MVLTHPLDRHTTRYSVKTIKNCGFYVLHKLDVGAIYENHPYFAGELEQALETAIMKQTKKRKGPSSAQPDQNAPVNVRMCGRDVCSLN